MIQIQCRICEVPNDDGRVGFDISVDVLRRQDHTRMEGALACHIYAVNRRFLDEIGKIMGGEITMELPFDEPTPGEGGPAGTEGER